MIRARPCTSLLVIGLAACAVSGRADHAPATSSPAGTRTPVTVDSVRSADAPGSKVPSEGLRILCAPGTPAAHPAVYVVDGVVLGLRADSTIDHALGEAMLARLDPTAIVSVTVMKASQAVARYGPGAHGGAILIETTRPRTPPEREIPN
jgi:hypothetical protein